VRLTMADTPMGADPVQNQPTPPSGACSPLPSPPASANFGEGDDAKLPPSSNTFSLRRPMTKCAPWYSMAVQSWLEFLRSNGVLSSTLTLCASANSGTPPLVPGLAAGVRRLAGGWPAVAAAGRKSAKVGKSSGAEKPFFAIS
jgi:hypothetical protein